MNLSIGTKGMERDGRSDIAWANKGYPKPVFIAFGPKGVEKAMQSMLAGAVTGTLLRADLTRYTARYNDMAASLRQHQWQNGFRQRNNTKEVDIHQLPVNRQIGIDNLTPLCNACILEYIVDPAKPLPNRFHMSGQTCSVCHIQG